MTRAMTAEALLAELAREHKSYGSYAELEQRLSDLMRRNHERVSAHVTADDILHYAAQHGLVRRSGQQLVIAVEHAAAA